MRPSVLVQNRAALALRLHDVCRCSDAAYALLNQRDAASEEQLTEFLATHFPEIPAEHRMS